MKISKFAFKLIASAATIFGIIAPTLAAPITHDDPGGFRTDRVAGSAPVGRLTVNSVQTLNSFGVDVDLISAGNLDFLIFNSSTGALLYQSGPKAFADTGAGFKFSDPFSFVFQPGLTYGLTANSDVGGTYLVDFVANTIGDFNFLTRNQNLGGTFASPSLDMSTNCCDVSTALNIGAIQSVPEPGTIALVGVALFGAFRARRHMAM